MGGGGGVMGEGNKNRIQKMKNKKKYFHTPGTRQTWE